MQTHESAVVLLVAPGMAVYLGTGPACGIPVHRDVEQPQGLLEAAIQAIQQAVEVVLTPDDLRVVADILLFPELGEVIKRETPWPDQTHLTVLTGQVSQRATGEGWYPIAGCAAGLKPADRLWLPEALQLRPGQVLEAEIQTSRSGVCSLCRHHVRQASSTSVAAVAA